MEQFCFHWDPWWNIRSSNGYYKRFIMRFSVNWRKKHNVKLQNVRSWDLDRRDYFNASLWCCFCVGTAGCLGCVSFWPKACLHVVCIYIIPSVIPCSLWPGWFKSWSGGFLGNLAVSVVFVLPLPEAWINRVQMCSRCGNCYTTLLCPVVVE